MTNKINKLLRIGACQVNLLREWDKKLRVLEAKIRIEKARLFRNRFFPTKRELKGDS